MLPELKMKDFDPLSMIAEPPPTFRADDERRKAQYVEMMFNMGRLHNFQKKIMELKDRRLVLLADRHLYSDVLTSLHRDSFICQHDIADLEQDLDRTGKLLATYEAMTKLWMQANKLLKQAERDKKKAEMRRCGVWEDVKEATDVAIHLKQETRSVSVWIPVCCLQFASLLCRLSTHQPANQKKLKFYYFCPLTL